MTPETATFSAGCYWCFDALFRQLRGVEKVVAGFAGGTGPITYEDLHMRNNGYSEAVQITFDPQIIPYTVLLDIFWHLHNPTEMNRQGADVGYQYRSAIFYHSPEQKAQAEESKLSLEQSHYYDKPLVTTIEPFTTFVPADEEHQDYYANHSADAYCVYAINPKLQKLREMYRDILK